MKKLHRENIACVLHLPQLQVVVTLYQHYSRTHSYGSIAISSLLSMESWMLLNHHCNFLVINHEVSIHQYRGSLLVKAMRFFDVHNQEVL